MHKYLLSCALHSMVEQTANEERHSHPVGTKGHHQTTSPFKEPWTRQLQVKGYGNPTAPGLVSHPTVRGDLYLEAVIHL